MPRQVYDIKDIKFMLLDRIEDVVARYAPPAGDHFRKMGLYYTLNPGRADRRVGSFVVQMDGSAKGRWDDYATGEFGDLIDLIALSLGCDLKEAVKEARRFLGLQADDPAAAARRQRAIKDGKRKHAQAQQRDRENAQRKSRQAQAIFLSGQSALRNTPVDYYLKGRGVDLSRLGRQPGVIRYVPECHYYDEDPETGEVIERNMPAMVAAVTDAKGNHVAVHRTYLALNGPLWAKARVRQAKKVLGGFGGAGINIWRGAGPRGGKPASLPQCPPGTHVFLTEGIEDALSVVLLKPEVRVVAAISLGNLAKIVLPQNVSTVTFVADKDENAQSQEALRRAIAAKQAEGREVRVWQNRHGGKDLNDALQGAGTGDAA